MLPRLYFLFGEPNLDLSLSTLYRVRTVANVALRAHSEVPADGTGLGVDGISLSKHVSTGLNNTTALPHHRKDGGRLKIVNQCREKGLSSKVGIVLFNLVFLHRVEFKSPQDETLLLKATDYSPHQSPLYPIRLNHNISPLSHSTIKKIITTLHLPIHLYSTSLCSLSRLFSRQRIKLNSVKSILNLFHP